MTQGRGRPYYELYWAIHHYCSVALSEASLPLRAEIWIQLQVLRFSTFDFCSGYLYWIFLWAFTASTHCTEYTDAFMDHSERESLQQTDWKWGIRHLQTFTSSVAKNQFIDRICFALPNITDSMTNRDSSTENSGMVFSISCPKSAKLGIICQQSVQSYVELHSSSVKACSLKAQEIFSEKFSDSTNPQFPMKHYFIGKCFHMSCSI